MQNPTRTLKALEHKFWQSLVDNDTDTALKLLEEPSLMVSPHGSMLFDHDSYRRMAEKGTLVLDSFELSDMDILFPSDSTAILSYDVRQVTGARGENDRTEQQMHDTSTWVRRGNNWRCVMHTETPAMQPGTRLRS